MINRFELIVISLYNKFMFFIKMLNEGGIYIQSVRRIFELLFSRKFFPPFMTFVILSVSALCITFLLTDSTLSIERENVILRTRPATNAQAIIQLDQGIEVNLKQEQNGWYKVRVNGKTEGWIPKWLLENTTLENDQDLAAQILINTPLYSSTDESSKVIQNIEPGSYLHVQAEDNGWLSVTFDGVYGYIPTRLVNLVSESVVPDSEEEIEEEAPYDKNEIERQRAEAEAVVSIRSNEEPLLDSPSFYAEPIAYAIYGEQLTLIDSAEDDLGNEFYLVEDSTGIRAYVDSTRVSISTYSIGHIGLPSANSLSEATIMIDPGHGGEDSGAISINDSFEKDATFDTAMALKAALEAQGATVMLTRPDDQFIELEDRVTASNLNQVDAFISLHFDGSEDTTWSGTTTYYYHESDELLAQSVNDQIAPLPLENIGILFGNYYVLRENTRPSILLELGYMSNQYDLQYIFNDNYHQNIAQAITQGLINYFDQVSQLR
ncbi:SH3 domain-containing protein [Aerococcaceae bacterium DSM 109652]|uniref:SH3 domain-containing protein n=2 Tax=Fundicoccus ignavus TaxID=2664442 RepID=A0A844C5V7_9LACT|nr:SH3 domain-containing protein [Fundicoccus ignavus]